MKLLLLSILGDIPSQLVIIVHKQASLNLTLPGVPDAVFLGTAHQAYGVIGREVVLVVAFGVVFAYLVKSITVSTSLTKERGGGGNRGGWTYNNQTIRSKTPVGSFLAVEEMDDFVVAACPVGRVLAGVQTRTRGGLAAVKGAVAVSGQGGVGGHRDVGGRGNGVGNGDGVGSGEDEARVDEGEEGAGERFGKGHHGGNVILGDTEKGCSVEGLGYRTIKKLSK